MNQKPRKRIYLINRDFQMRYSLAASVVGIISTALTSTVIIVPLFTFKILKTTTFLPTPIFFGMAFACIVNIAIIMALGIFVTHKIAGPMYSLVRSFRMVTEGTYSAAVKIREDDDMRYVVRNFNEMIEAVSQNTKEDLAILQDVLQSDLDPVQKDRLNILAHRLSSRLPNEG